jgi:hypothetical protein
MYSVYMHENRTMKPLKMFLEGGERERGMVCGPC